jgi:hypothetical protein
MNEGDPLLLWGRRRSRNDRAIFRGKEGGGGRENHPDDNITLSKPGLELSKRELGSRKLTNAQEEE